MRGSSYLEVDTLHMWQKYTQYLCTEFEYAPQLFQQYETNYTV